MRETLIVSALRDIIRSSDANDGDALANAIQGARKLVQGYPAPSSMQDVIDRLVDALGLLGFADPGDDVNGGDCVDVICEHWDELAALASVWPLTEDQQELCARVQVGTRVLSVEGETSDTDHGEQSTGPHAIGTITAIDLSQQNAITVAFEPSGVSVVLSFAELDNEDKYEIDPEEVDETVYTTREDVIRAVEGWLGHEGSYELATRVYEYMREQGMVEHNGAGFVIERDTNVFEIAADLSQGDMPKQDGPYPAGLARDDHLLSADELRVKYGTDRDRNQHPRYTVLAWSQDTVEGNTKRGYWDWVAAQLEQEQD